MNISRLIITAIVIFFLAVFARISISGELIDTRAELEEILGDSLVLEDFESVEPNFGILWIGPVLDSEAGIIDGIVFTREPSGNLQVEPLPVGNQRLSVNMDAIAIDFVSPTPAVGFDYYYSGMEVTLNVYAEDDETLLDTEIITTYWPMFIGYYEESGIGKITVSSVNLVQPAFPHTAIDNVTFGISVVEMVNVDIKPRNEANTINPRSPGVLAVAIITEGDFDALQVDPMTVHFGPAGAMDTHNGAHAKDVDDDGDIDLLFHFRIPETGILCGDNSATLIGSTWDGSSISGTDFINTVGCK